MLPDKAIFGAFGPQKYKELSKFEYGSRFRRYRIACQIVNQRSTCHRGSVTSGSRTRIGMATLLQIVLPEYFCLRLKIWILNRWAVQILTSHKCVIG